MNAITKMVGVVERTLKLLRRRPGLIPWEPEKDRRYAAVIVAAVLSEMDKHKGKQNG